MRSFGPSLSFVALIIAAVTLVACGGSSHHVLQSVSISPASADAQNFPGGQVQFTATGYFNNRPSPVTPLGANWGACVVTAGSEQPSNDINISDAGLASCRAGASGTYKIWASSSNSIPGTVTCQAMGPCGTGCGRVTGSAQLTCP
ncbi:MAG TPA: hypothetical protein VKV39_08455 [Candidatus Sulfotelmatobacter sp.]|nr:hypothetical protein [Candidatus Sulfotelmatobacter sp.]